MNCIIIGAGAIGALKPDNIDGPNTENILTHAHAISNNPDLNLIGIVDKDVDKAMAARLKWSCIAFDSIDSVIKFNKKYNSPKIDLVVVATPPETHYQIIREIVRKIKPEIVICEKPFCSNLNEALKAKAILRKTKVLINYTRRYSKMLFEFCSDFRNEEFGKAISITCHYTRGLVRDGSHAINFIQALSQETIGKASKGTVTELSSFITNKKNNNIFTNTINDYLIEDLTTPVQIVESWCPNIFLIPHDGREFDVFDFDIYTTEYRIQIVDHGDRIIFNKAKGNSDYGNYKDLKSGNQFSLRTDLKKSLENLYLSAVDAFENQNILPCGISQAINVHNMLNVILKNREMHKRITKFGPRQYYKNLDELNKTGEI